MDIPDIPEYLIETIFGNIDQRLKQNFYNFYENLFNMNNKEENLKLLIKDIIQKEFMVAELTKISDMDLHKTKHTFIAPDKINKLKRYNLQQIKQTKKRWYNSLFKRKKTNPFNIEIETANNNITLYGPEVFFNLYKVRSIEELKDIRAAQFKDWLDNSIFITDFFYLKSKTNKQINTAFNLDFIYNICTIIYDKWNNNLNFIYMEYPKLLLDHPLVADGSGKIKVQKQTIIQQNQSNKNVKYKYNDYVSKDGITRILVPESNIDTKQSRLIDNKDLNILSNILKYKKADFLTNKTIVFNLIDIINNIYCSKTVRSYEDLRNRIAKMTLLKFNFFRTDNISGIPDAVYGIFSSYEYLDKSQNRVKVYVDSILYDKILKNQVYTIYNDKINQLNDDFAKTLVIYLQQEKLVLYTQGKNTTFLSYDYFSNLVRFRYKKEERNYKIIAQALENMKCNNIIIRDFKKHMNGFIITFLDTNQFEISDLFSNKNTSDILPMI
ncbi:hypothetical protein AGE29_01305 (plasmid) [Clostridium botulinum]|uniref:hypothetical protein n=1 Tax=Clostridium botulinum TaxID=1491 RepID=UPI000E096478|nr:hypothetical protein [Clostridium botulinum]AXG90475.1 hypothetical protein AGE29_01305 [Clostridium botulinum]